MYNKIILHIPHSSDNFGCIEPWCLAYGKIWREKSMDLIDWYTDRLFVPERATEDIIPIVFPFCRTACDVERMSHDPLEEKGLGIINRELLRSADGTFDIFEKGFEKSLLKIYLEHQHKLATLLVDNPGAILIDCHSFSSGPTTLLPDATSNKEVDICIGFNDDFTKPEKSDIDGIADCFRNNGFKVSFNSPFSNSKTVDTPANYRSLMIEVNKSLYMDEATLTIKEEAFLHLKHILESVYRLILKG